jgi:hypothetical protein
MNKNKSHPVTLRVVYSTLTDVENDFGDYITGVFLCIFILTATVLTRLFSVYDRQMFY